MTFPVELKIKFKNLVNERSGLYFKDYDLRDLERAVTERLKACGLDSPIAYYELLVNSSRREDEFRELLNILTVNHTYFFRNEPQFKALKEKILPEIIRNKTIYHSPSTNNPDKPVIRIWSAGCSTGEEPYSIAIILKELIPDLENWDIQILATDASTNALAAAKKGIYNTNALRLVSAEHRSKYFQAEHSSSQAAYKLHDDIRKMVNFEYFNLMEESYPQNFDIIFCRNVTIYFQIETTMAVMEKFCHSLRDEGFLFIGYSETLQFISDKFRMLDWEDAIYYAKYKTIGHKPEPKVFVPQGLELEKILADISRKEVEAQVKESQLSYKEEPRPSIQEILAEIIKNLHIKKYYVALDLAGQAHQLDKEACEPYYFEAEALSSLGRLEEAKEKLKTALKQNGLFAPAHYLSGSFFVEEGLLEEAKRSFKKTVYLDRNFILAYFGLANVYKNEGRADEAIREYRNTLNILSKNLPDDIIAYSGGFNAVAVAGACKSNIERLKSGGDFL